MTRQTRTLYHAQINYLQHRPYSRILDESHSYDRDDAIERMIQETVMRFPQENGYRCDFNPNNFSYAISKYGEAFATLTLHSSDDGIDL